MEIELDNIKREGVSVGDIIEYTGGIVNKAIGLVLENKEVILLKYTGGGDWFSNWGGTFKTEFEKGNYRILAKADEWKIVRR